MTAYVQKIRSIRLNLLLTLLNLTLGDLPTFPLISSSETSLCFNYVLGKCEHNECQHKHMVVTEVTDRFATKIIKILNPAINNFLTNGTHLHPLLVTNGSAERDDTDSQWFTNTLGNNERSLTIIGR